MNCGQDLPDGAKFCLKCGTPQGSTSPTGSVNSETINFDGTHTFVPAKCPNCGAQLKVDSSFKIAHCDSCDTDCLVQDAIKALTVRGNVQVGNATINVNSTNTDSLLQRVEIMVADGDFGDAMSKCDTILDSDPTNGKVYFFMLLCNLRCRTKNELANYPVPFDGNKYYIKAVQYGDDSLKSELVSYINSIKASNEVRRNKEIEEYELKRKIEEENELKRKIEEENELKRKKEEEIEIKRKREEEAVKARLKNIIVGNTFYFGTNKGRELLWKVLRIQNGRALIITTDIVCKMPYHLPGGSITWSDCTLRKWLNSVFINNSFTHAEQARIVPCDLNNDNNPQYRTSGGSPTTDKVFLFNLNEANMLLANNMERSTGFWWWLRSPGKNPSEAAHVREDGMVFNYGPFVSDGDGGVRPAMWIEMNQ